MNICDYCANKQTCKNKPLCTTRCRDYKEETEQMRCPKCKSRDVVKMNSHPYQYYTCKKCNLVWEQIKAKEKEQSK